LLAWLGLTEAPLSLPAQVNPVALSFQTALVSAPAAGVESWPITAQVPTHRMIVVSKNFAKLSRLFFQSIKPILSREYKVLPQSYVGASIMTQVYSMI
jgi:hypothetical protein